MSMESGEELNDSELGTLEYWQNTYKTELTNFKDHGDVGEIWFGENIEESVIQWMVKNVDKSSSILDVGCGNGMLLVHLALKGFKHLKGVDYAEDAIHLAKAINIKYKTNIEFCVGDILQLRNVRYDVILDKGTYDAVSLMSNSKNSRETYKCNVYDSINKLGFLVLTSCNWTKDELQNHFSDKFTLHDCLPTPQFIYGGKIGNIVSSVILKKLDL